VLDTADMFRAVGNDGDVFSLREQLEQRGLNPLIPRPYFLHD
jgi:hypothetical protein